MKKSHRIIVISLTLAVAFIIVPTALAHPLGNFTINHYAGLHLTRDTLAIDYVLDMAEIPAFQELSAYDTNGNSRPDAGEFAGYASAQCEAIGSELTASLDGRATALALTSSSVEFPAGAGGLLTLRLTCAFSAPIALDGEKTRLDFKDHSYADRLGWREIVVTADGVSLQGEFASTSVSLRLTAYPDDMLSSPLDQRAVSIELTPGGAGAPDGGRSLTALRAAANPAAARGDAFTQLITLQSLTPLTILFALGASFVWGAMHAMSPGHGKTMVAAYLVGAKGTPKHAVMLGSTVTITHTLGVFALGAVTLFASNYILPEQLYPYLSLASGVLVLGIGLTLFITRFRFARSGKPLIPRMSSHDHHDHDHDHPHEHDHSHDHRHDHAHVHDPHHEPGGHTHDPSDANGRITLRSLLALGISGGLIPCPTALVVLLSAIALGRTAFGMLLIVSFSAGLAAVLMAIGLLFVQGRRVFDRIPAESRMVRLLPLTGAALVIITGVVMTAQAIAN